MGLVRGHLIGEGIRISGNNRVLEIILRSFQGPPTDREGYFRVNGVEGIDTLHLRSWDKPVDLGDGITVELASVEAQRCGRLSVHYNAPEKYRFDRIYPTTP